jgi:hypothetical protein
VLVERRCRPRGLAHLSAATVKGPALVGVGGTIATVDVCFIVRVALVVQAVAEGEAQAAEEGLSPTALCWSDVMMGEIRVVMGRTRGSVGG